MFRREQQERTAIKRVWPRRENANFVVAFIDLEINLSTFASANPIALEQLDSFRPIKLFEFIE